MTPRAAVFKASGKWQGKKSGNRAKKGREGNDGAVPDRAGAAQTGVAEALSFRLRDLDLISFGILGNKTARAHQTTCQREFRVKSCYVIFPPTCKSRIFFQSCCCCFFLSQKE